MFLFQNLKKNIRVVGALCGIATSVIGVVALSFFPHIVHKLIDLNVILYENSDQFERWQTLPQPLQFKVFIFNVTNPDEIHKGALPIVKECGPYVYNQYRVKKVEAISPDKTTITYTSKHIYEFDRTQSYPFNEDDQITVLNVVTNVIFQIKDEEIKRIVGKLTRIIHNSADQTLAVRNVMHLIEIVSGNPKSVLQITEDIINSQLGFINENILRLFGNEKSIFLTTAVRKYLFDGIPFCINVDKVLDFICKLIDDVVEHRKIKVISKMKDGGFNFAFFKYKNNTDDGRYKIYTGKNDSSLTARIVTWEGRSHLTIWKNESSSLSTCNLLDNSTDGIAFPPHLKPQGSLLVYSTDICRKVELYYEKKITYEGIPGYRFIVGDNYLKKVGSKYSTKCFCSSGVSNIPKYADGCLFSGVLDGTVCHGVPIIISMPHFIHAAKEYRTVKGMKPNLKVHQTFVDLEPQTGYPLRGYKRAQFNMFVRKVDKIDVTRNLKTFLMPIVWVEEGIELNDKMVGLLYNKLLIPILAGKIAICVVISLGILIFVGMSLLRIRQYYLQRKNRVKIIRVR